MMQSTNSVISSKMREHRSMFNDYRPANTDYAATFELADLSNRSTKELAIVTCMDTRIDPFQILGLQPGHAIVIRNAGGRVTDDVLRSLVLAVNLLGVNNVAIMHHTECALAGRSEDDLQSKLDEQVRRAINWKLLAMPDPDASLRDDVDAVRNCDAVPNVYVQGWRYDVRTGLVHTVVQ